MKTSKILFVITAIVSASFAFAADARNGGKQRRQVLHDRWRRRQSLQPLLIAAAKDGKNCEKCGGTNVAKK